MISPLVSDQAIRAAQERALFFGPQFGGLGVSALSEAERLRLVKGSKSPTSPKSDINIAIFNNLSLKRIEPSYVLADSPKHYEKNCVGPGRYVVVGHREWSDEYRIRPEIVGTTKMTLPENTGRRVTEILTTRGARKIAESCDFMGKTRGGYSTFLTLTLAPEARERVENGETTIQNEVSRFFDGLQKMYQRGFDCEIDGKTEHLPASPVLDGKPERLDYLWVAECPDHIDKETGEVGGNNPHVHVLMRYRVPYRFFEAWSKRVESLWGQGTAHLEKIKDGSKAGAYMAKAAGYLCKAQGKSDQGKIRGNRYNISRSARAPDWVCVGRYELGKMGFLLSEAEHDFKERFGHIDKKRKQLTKQLSKAEGPARHKIGKILEKVRSTIAKMPRLSRYQAILKGKAQYSEFMQWAANDGVVSGHDWLPEKEKGDGFIEKSGRGQWLTQFKLRRAGRIDRKYWASWHEIQRYIQIQDEETHGYTGFVPEAVNDYLFEYFNYIGAS